MSSRSSVWGGVFFRRSARPSVEVINDISEDVSTLFRILQRHYAAFIQELRFNITSRAEFERLISVDASTLTDIERAARFLYIQRLAFGGKVAGRSFGTSTTAPGRFNLTTLEPMLADVHERLAGVVIERMDWRTLVDTYDRARTLFYMDPPYYGCEDDYGKNVFARSEFEVMAERLGSLDGAAIVSLNDTPEVREIFAEHRMLEVTLTYQVGGAPTEAKEVIILSPRAAAAIVA